MFKLIIQSFQYLIIKKMDWVINSNQNYQTQLALLKKLDKVTLYNHNSILNKNLQQLTFSCIFNCKRLNRQYSILGKVQGDLLNHTIQINCALVDYNRIVIGKWQHQKIQLTKFAYRYNQKSVKYGAAKTIQENNNYQIKVNPLSGEFYVCYHFLLGNDLIKDIQKFKMKMTDECQKLTSQSEKIFNTIIQVIFDQQANDPYLKSDQRVGMHFSRPVKMGKLLKKIKKLNTISSFYKIKQDIAVQNKYRSVFKKIFLRKNQKIYNNQMIIENALLYIPKFCKKHLDALPQNALPAKKKNLIITSFEDLQDNHEIQFATRHLEDFYKNKSGDSVVDITNLFNPQERLKISQPGFYEIRGLMIRVDKLASKQKKIYQEQLLSKISFKHPHIFQYYLIKDQQFNSLRVTEYLSQISLEQYLHVHSTTISLSTRLDIMTQICHVVQVLHKNHIGYFLDWKNIFITAGNIVKIRDFSAAYSVSCWDQTKIGKDIQKKYLMDNFNQYLAVCGITPKPEQGQNREKMQQEKNKFQNKFQNQRADIFSLGMVLYRILIGKFPFSINCINLLQQNYKKVDEFLNQIWTVQTEFFLRQGGMVVKLLAHLLLKCLHIETEKRPYVEWITVILSEVKSSLECLY